MYRIDIPMMEEIGTINSENQPLQILWRLFCAYARQTIHMTLHSLITRELLPSFNVETVFQSSSKLVPPFFQYNLISSSFHHKKYLYMQSSFFSFVFIAQNPGIFSKSVHTLVYLITHLFPVGLQPNLDQHSPMYALPVK